MRLLPLLSVPVALAASLSLMPGASSATPDDVSGTVTSHASLPSGATTGHRAGTHYAFGAVLDGRPVRWDPCTPIRWTSSTSRGPKGGLAVLKAAVARTAAVTGTRWVYAGETRTAPSTASLPRSSSGPFPPVVLGWADARSSDLLRGTPASVLGVTRTRWFGRADASGRRIAATRGAVVALDRTERLPLRGRVSWYATALHELGHVVGLEHPRDGRQLMASTLPRHATDLQPGDLAGLRLVGRAAGCVRVPGRSAR